jgi:hypothetical protein
MTKKILKADKFLAEFLQDEGWITIPTIEDEFEVYYPEHICDFGDSYLELPLQKYYSMGRRPHYQYEKGLMFHINKNLNESAYTRMKAWGDWGSGVVSTEFLYKNFKRKSKYRTLIENLHKIIFGEND